MNKTSGTAKIDETYEIVEIFNNIAVVKNSKKETGLVDIKTGQIVGDFNQFNTTISYQFVIQKLKGTIYYRFFNVAKVQMLIDYAIWMWSKEEKNLYIVQNNETKKYRLIDLENYATKSDISDREFDEVKFVYTEKNVDYFKIVDGPKTYLFSRSSGLVEHEDFEQVYKIGCAKIFHVRNKDTNQIEYYLEYSIDGEIVKEKIESYQIVGLMDRFIAVKKGNSTYIYKATTNKISLVAEIPACEKVSLLSYAFLNEAGGFVIENNNKKGLLLLDCTHGIKKIIDIEYDDIKVARKDEMSYYLTKDNKKGICGIKDGLFYFQEAVYDGIEKHRLSSTFSKEGRQSDVLDKFLVRYDSFEPIRYYFYIVTTNGKKGLVSNLDNDGHENNGKLVIPVQYDSIEFKIEGNNIFLILKNGEYYKYAYISYKHYIRFNMYEDPNEYSKIELLEDVVVKIDAKTKELLVFDYNDNLLNKFPPNSSISEVPKNEYKGPNQKAKSIYLINGEYYYFINNKLVKLPNTQIDLYMTVYESEFGTVVVNDHDKETHDVKCAAIEQIPEEEFEATLKEHFKSSPELQEQYPTLTLKLDK